MEQYDEEIARAVASSLEDQKRLQEEEADDLELKEAIRLSLLAAPIGTSSRAEEERETLERKRRREEAVKRLTTGSIRENAKRPRTFPDLKYPNGSVHLTYVQGHSRSLGEYVRFEELVDKEKLRRAFFSAYAIDFDWLLGRMPSVHGPDAVSLCIAKHWSSMSGEQAGTQRISNRLVVVNPPMPVSGFGCMHAKLMILGFDHFLRVVISSANLMRYDWEQLENMVFVQDFPLLNPSSETKKTWTFSEQLRHVLQCMKVPSSVIETLDRHDFSLAEVQLVASIAGSHRGDDALRYGHPGLARAVEAINMKTMESEYEKRCLSLEYQTSSLGALNSKWMNEFYRSACGLKPAVSVAQRNLKKANPLIDLPPATVIFPSLSTVVSSNMGPEGAGTICFLQKHYLHVDFPKTQLRDCTSLRKGSLMHSKILIAQKLDSETTDKDNATGWCYMGSHNFTASAWGTVTASTGLLWIKNWEIGVVLPTHRMNEKVEGGSIYWKRKEANSLRLPVPYQRPARPYAHGDDPWFRDGD